MKSALLIHHNDIGRNRTKKMVQQRLSDLDYRLTEWNSKTPESEIHYFPVKSFDCIIVCGNSHVRHSNEMMLIFRAWFYKVPVYLFKQDSLFETSANVYMKESIELIDVGKL